MLGESGKSQIQKCNLNRNDIIEELSELKFRTADYWVVTGAAMVLHGVKTETGDIDLGCTTNLCEELIKQGCYAKILDDGSRFIKINDDVEAFENWCVDNIDTIDGYPVASLESIKKQKLSLGREKDFKDIDLIDEYISKLYK